MPLRRQTADARFLVVSFEALGRRVAFTPSVPDLYFEVTRGQQVAARARDVLTDHFRKLEKDEDQGGFVYANHVRPYVRAWTTTLDLDVHPELVMNARADEGLLALFGGGKPDGRAELSKVGRCLDWLYPDDLDRVVLRDREVEELVRLLAEEDRRPVLLLGPRKSGKTAILHETVWRRVDARKNPHVAEKNVWLLAPPRLISGMSYVGQWEGRLLAILEETRKRDHVLYFDDVLGLYQAGRSADSDLSVAQVLRGWVERREVRVLAEMTPEQFRVLREKDRGLADAFHTLPVHETGDPQTRRILIHHLRRLEGRHKTRFDANALPTVMDLESRYVRDQAMPGKAAGFLAALALKFHGRDVTRATALEEFQARSGLAVSFLDPLARLERADVVDALRAQLIGQEQAVQAMADVVSIAKARLNDPTRPLGGLLFLGPTGVGKTQAAKALAAYLFGDESRLIRFDMNEYVDPVSPSRLIGTFSQPEGLLTGAVRRQPFCVLLLDEIEKAHPAVFDLLLQVLGEGRLTDSVGRTSDFTNAIIVMTSNLGTREASTAFGLKPRAAGREEVFLDAAKAFFRPEFFNRIDRLVPFNALSREHVAQIARGLIRGLFAREGLVHRRCVLHVEPEAMNRIVTQGYHPHLGARALKRAVERQLTEPLAGRLAALAPDAPTVVTVYPSGDGVVPHLQPMTHVRTAAPLPPIDDRDALLDRVEDYLNKVEADHAAAPARLSADNLSAEQFRYLAISEQIKRIDRLIQRIDNPPRGRPRATTRNKPAGRMKRLIADAADLLARGDLHARLGERVARAQPVEDEGARELLREVALLRAVVDESSADRVLVFISPVGSPPDGLLAPMLQAYLRVFSKPYGFSASRVVEGETVVLLLEMPGIGAVVRGEAGTHLVCAPGEGLLPVRVSVEPLAAAAEPAAVARERLAARERWRSAVAAGTALPEEDPEPLGPIVRIYDPVLATLDLRTGLVCPGWPWAEELRWFLLAGLPLPEGVLE
jgi:ATP-dependent Clp protease ATP-binding subunit ClpA